MIDGGVPAESIAEPSRDRLRALATACGRPHDDITPVTRPGAANHTYLLGADLVLRVARAGFEADLRKEAALVPRAVAAGIRTPEMVHFEESPAAAPFLVTRRHDGQPPRLPSTRPDDPRGESYRQLGEQLALVHDTDFGSPTGIVSDPAPGPRTDLESLRADGYVGDEVAEWVDAWLARLDAMRWRGTPRFVHGDAAPQNLLVDGGDLTALLDWGDAHRTEAAVDFAKLPLRAVPHALRGYRSIHDRESGTFEAAILWYQLAWALARIPTGPDRVQTHWSAQPANRLLEILRFLCARPPEPWNRLGPDGAA